MKELTMFLVGVLSVFGGPTAVFGGWIWDVEAPSSAPEAVHERPPVHGSVAVAKFKSLAIPLRIVGRDDDVIGIDGQPQQRGRDVDTGVTFSENGTVAAVNVERASRTVPGGRSGLVIRVPRRVRCEFSAVSAGVAIQGVDGGVDGSSVSGAVSLVDCGGTVAVRNVSGAIDVTGERVAGFELKTTSGAIRFHGTVASNCECSVKTVSGAVRLEVPRAAGAVATTRTVSGRVRDGFGEAGGAKAPRLHVRTVSGSVDLTTY